MNKTIVDYEEIVEITIMIKLKTPKNTINQSIKFRNINFPVIPVLHQSFFQRFLVPDLLNPRGQDIILNRHFTLTLMCTKSNL